MIFFNFFSIYLFGSHDIGNMFCELTRVNSSLITQITCLSSYPCWLELIVFIQYRALKGFFSRVIVVIFFHLFKQIIHNLSN